MSHIAIRFGLAATVSLSAACYVQRYPEPAAPAPAVTAPPGFVQPGPAVVQPGPVVLQPGPAVVQPGPVVLRPAPGVESGRPLVVRSVAPQGNTLEVVNRTGQVVCHLYLSVAGEEWGADRLGDDTLPEGGSVTIPLDGPASRWDLLAEDCDHAEIADYRDEPLPGDLRWEVVANGDGEDHSYGTLTASGFGEEQDDSVSGGPASRGAATVVAAAAYWLGASGSDLGHLRSVARGNGPCAFVDDSDLRGLCGVAFEGSGSCSFIHHSDLSQLCRTTLEGSGTCSFIDDSDLRGFCSAVEGSGPCSFIHDSDLNQLCAVLVGGSGSCAFIDDSNLREACSGM